MDSVEKARETRRKNEEARIALIREQTAARRAARLALIKVFESPDSTSEQILTAAELLEKLGI